MCLVLSKAYQSHFAKLHPETSLPIHFKSQSHQFIFFL